MLSMQSNSGEQDSDFLICTEVLGPYQRCIQSGQSRTTQIIAVGPDEKIISKETDYYMSASSDKYFNELSQMSGFVVNAKYPSQGPTDSLIDYAKNNFKITFARSLMKAVIMASASLICFQQNSKMKDSRPMVRPMVVVKCFSVPCLHLFFAVYIIKISILKFSFVFMFSD